ncbi:MAG TPA: metal-dependent transcriptional regulator [Thermomicrobiaceae bacterium]|nr:metal-dependent transcriptional regulator [Thermomicrobiaceae bacterium]
MVDIHLSSGEEDYLRAIYHLSQESQGEPVGTLAIATWLEVAAASVTNMVKKLAGRGLVDHSPYRGVTLTPLGRRAALEVVRHHRLLEQYLHEQLGMPWEQVHVEADRLEHALSEAVEERIDRLLGHPTTDPHGAPIPSKSGTIERSERRPLWQIAPESIVVVAEVADEEADLLTYLEDLGLTPGTRVEVLAKSPFDGPLQVRVGAREYALGERVARAVQVTSVAGRP